MTNNETRGLRRLIEPDMLIALSAILVSFCALGVSVIQVQIMREEQRANAWPRVEAYVNTGTAFLMKLTNKGFGPAMIKAVVVTVDSVPIRDWSEATKRLLPDRSVDYTQSKITDVVLSPQTDVQILLVPAGEPSIAMSAETARIGMEICYCSVYEDCWWLRRSFGGGARWTYEEVEECAIDDRRRFSM